MVDPFRHLIEASVITKEIILVRAVIIRKIIRVQIGFLINHVLRAATISIGLMVHVVVCRVIAGRDRPVGFIGIDITTGIKREPVVRIKRKALTDRV